ncbi:unnamed protein product [Linum trigynum]|uniref:DUF4283 domain-containing protein n=1 Tax=Linum trigynum TaxID=586398 RepID=A0AAV2DVT1_9ROSI
MFVLRRWTNKLWGRDGQVRVSYMCDQLLLIQLPSQSTYEWILENGPWFYFENLLYLRPWTPGISVEDLGRKALPIWFKMTNVPLEYVDYEGLGRIASWIGIPLGVDQTTKLGGRLGLAKVLVELIAGDAFPDHITLWPVEDRSIKVGLEYCFLPPVCRKCKLFGKSCGCEMVVGKQVWVKKVQSVEDRVQANNKGKEVISDMIVDPQLAAICDTPIQEASSSGTVARGVQGFNLDRSFLVVANASAHLQAADEFQRVVHGARPRVWSPRASPTSVLHVSPSSFSVLSDIDESEVVKLQVAPRKDSKKLGAKPPSFI